jgi:4a-hydroxytetrahydrobiopterin dehydratase
MWLAGSNESVSWPARLWQHGCVALLSDAEIEERLAALPEWRRAGEAIGRTYECGDFVGSVNFVESMVGPAESLGHHPDLEISWDRVTVTISTHSEGGLTAADFELAAKLDAAYPSA